MHQRNNPLNFICYKISINGAYKGKSFELDHYVTSHFNGMLRLFCVVLTFSYSLGYPRFMDEIPNGHNVKNPYNGEEKIWSAVGHKASGGGGPINPFGKAFKEAGDLSTGGFSVIQLS